MSLVLLHENFADLAVLSGGIWLSDLPLTNMKYALIGSDNIVQRVSNTVSDAAYPLRWVDCSDDVMANQYRYDGNSFVRIRTTPNRRVSKSDIVVRLQAVGLLEVAKAAIDSNLYTRERWYAPGQSWVYSNDPEAIALLEQIGADPYEILE